MKELECAADSGQIIKFSAEKADIDFGQAGEAEAVMHVTQDGLTTSMSLRIVEGKLEVRLQKQERIKKKTTRGKDDGPKDNF